MKAFIPLFIGSVALMACEAQKIQPPANPVTLQTVRSSSTPELTSDDFSQEDLKSEWAKIVQQSITSDPSLHAIEIEIRAAQYSTSTLEKWYKPTIELSGSVPIASSSATTSSSTALILTQPIWDFGRRQSNLRLAQSSGALKQSQLRGLQHELIERLGSLYVTNGYLNERRAIMKEKLDVFQALSTQISTMLDQGIATKDELDYAEIQIFDAENEITQIDFDLEDNTASWAHYTDRPIPRYANVFTKILRNKGCKSPDSTLKRAYEKNAEIDFARKQFEQSSGTLEVTKRSALPTLNGVARAEFPNGKPNTSIGLTIDVPILNTDNKTSVKTASFEVERSKAQLEEAQRTTAFDIRSHWNTSQNGHKRQIAIQKKVESLQKREAQLSDQISGGFATFDKLIDAKVSTYEAQLKAIDYRFQSDTADLKLLKLCGW